MKNLSMGEIAVRAMEAQKTMLINDTPAVVVVPNTTPWYLKGKYYNG